MRRIPTQIPSAVSRLIQGRVIQQPPTWYIPALAHPPPQLPPYTVKSRPRPNQSAPEVFTDTSFIPEGELERRDRLRGWKQRKGRPERLVYDEDKVRRQFFKDFPFEALRPISMVEGQEINVTKKIEGTEWTRLEQRGAYPTVEDCVEFVVNLNKTHSLPISEAYATATSEFVELRGQHQYATIAAEIEARHYGATFKPDVFERQFNLEEKAFSSLATSPAAIISTDPKPRKIKYKKQPRWQWTNSLPPTYIPSESFSGGDNYVAKWRIPEPIRPVTGGKREGDLLSAIPNTKKAEDVDEIEQGSELDFLKSVLASGKL